MRRHFATLVAFVVLGATPSLQTQQDVSGGVDALFADFASGSTPGCVIGVVQQGKVILAKAYGMADLEHRVPLTTRSSFYMASVSKQFMSLSILLLEQQRQLRVDDSVRKYIPELPSYADAITLRHLLHHTSGLRDYLTLGSLAGYSAAHVWTESGALRMIARQRHLNFPAGTEHLYSNSGYVLLAMVASRVAGRPLDEWAREHVFSPLAMSNTRFQHDYGALIPERAVGYMRQNDTWRLGISMLDVVGDGGLYSTLDDMLRWAANFDDERRWPELLLRMQTVGFLDNGTAIANGYGMGLARGQYRGLDVIGHGGALVGYRTIFFRVPGQKLSIVCMCNGSTANTERLAQQVAELYLGHTMSPAVPTTAPAPAQPAPASPVPSDLRRALAGTFYSPELDAVYIFREEGERLIVEVGDRSAMPVVRIGSDRLRLERGGAVIVPDKDASGRVHGYTLEAGRVRGLQFTRR